MNCDRINYAELFALLNLEIPKNSGDFELFRQALTHRSYIADNNMTSDVDSTLIKDYDRLEFLGDAILKYTINAYLFHTYSAYNSGQLTKLSSYLLSDRLLTVIAEEMGLARFVLTSRKIKPRKVIADCLESIFGAAYIVYGLERAKALILNLYEGRIEAADSSELKDNYRAALQEFTQGRGLGLPKYTLIGEEGPPHRRMFKMRVVCSDATGLGLGRSKKEASQMAARNALKELVKMKLVDYELPALEVEHEE